MDGLSSEARSVFEALKRPGMGADGLSLCLEAARVKDRLDRLDAILSGADGETFATIVKSKSVLQVRANAALQEARQLETVYRQLIESIVRGWPEGGGDDEEDALAGL